MRIAIAGQTWGPENGPGVFTQRLGQRLARGGHDVLALVPGRGMRSDTRPDGGVTVAAIPGFSLSPFYPEVRVTPMPFHSTLRILELFRPDVVHIQDHYPLSRAAVRAAERLRIPIVATNHFLPANMLPHMGPLRRFSTTERFLWSSLATVFNRAGAVTTPTETAAEILRPHLRVPVTAISCGVDVDRFRVPTSAERAMARSQWATGPDEILFAYVGRLDREKRIATIVEAMARVRNGAVRVVVAGRGRHERSLRALARARGVAERIAFSSFLTDFDLIALLRAGDFFVMPSDVELQSIATLEAMATGLPVLAAGALALPELVEDGVNGALFAPGDAADAAKAIDRLAASGEQWTAMSCASRMRAERHAIGRTVAAYEGVYEALSSQPSALRERIP